ncbi:unnamed protein product [Echinostoma caproni]|uniref:Spermatogenesis associated 17 n=1 Tax=Echinostoma caproni TaxID=27848 RepID=A0A183AVL2_9TREM|nr:unnamed protein product [Echinostoma caproni]
MVPRNSNSMLHETWRGFLGRREYRKVLSEAVIRLRIEMYHRCATKIQSAWRGYLTRKYKFNFYARNVYLQALKEVGQCIRERLAEYEADSQEKMEVQLETETKDRLWQWAKANHYRASTFSQPGIYNTRRNYIPDPREGLLRAAGKMLAQECIPSRVKWKEIKRIPPTSAVETPMADRKSFTNSESKLPEIKGPFRPRSAVRRWKQTPITLSLRVLSDYFSLEKARQAQSAEEWINRVHDEP